jgi:hypothetical protein
MNLFLKYNMELMPQHMGSYLPVATEWKYIFNLYRTYQVGDDITKYSKGLHAAQPAFDSWQGQEVFSFFTVSIPALVSTQPSGHSVLGLFPCGKVAGV